LQVKPQVPAVQVVVAFARAGQTFPQLPQLLTVVLRFTSHPLAARPSQLPQPALHVKPQVPAAQVAVALGGVAQTLPHAPQLLTVVLRFTSHPLAARPSQLPQPALHEATVQVLAAQPAAAFASTQA
jgi:hypothetical protein